MIEIAEDLVLKPLTVEDAPLLFNVLDTEREYMRIWLPFVDGTKVVEDTEAAVKYMIEDVNKQFCIFFKSEFVGLIGFKDTDAASRRTEIGYWLSQKAQGKGVMTRSVSALLDYAFQELDMNRIQIRVAVGNKASLAIPIKLGFKFEGTERDGELLSGNVFTDIAVYSLLKKEYVK